MKAYEDDEERANEVDKKRRRAEEEMAEEAEMQLMHECMKRPVDA